MVYVSHDLAVVARMADRIIVMYAGRIVEDAPANEVILRARHPYTRALVAAIPDFRRPRALRGIPGVTVGVGDWPAGCSFAARCAYVEPRCEEAIPPLDDVAPGHAVRCIRCHEIAPAPAPASVRRARASEAPLRPLLEVSGLEARYRSGRAAWPAVRDVVVHDRGGPLRRAGRRVGQRQDDDRSLHRGTARALGGPGRLRRPAAGRRCTFATARGAPADPDRVPEPVRVAQPAPPRRRVDRAAAARAAASLAARRRAGGGGPARAGAPAEAARSPLPDRALRRRAPARRDRARPRGEARPADLRRGHLRARRLGAGRRAGAAAGAAGASSGSACCSSPTTSASWRASATRCS